MVRKGMAEHRAVLDENRASFLGLFYGSCPKPLQRQPGRCLLCDAEFLYQHPPSSYL